MVIKVSIFICISYIIPRYLQFIKYLIESGLFAVLTVLGSV